MSLIQEIVDVARGLKSWQQLALREIFKKQSLASTDVDSIHAMMLENEAEPTQRAANAIQFSAADIPGAGSGSTVILCGIEKTEGVNAFPNDRSIAFATAGINIVFGGNGAGKSGYARLLKSTCNARKRTEVLPNAFSQLGSSPPPSANVRFEVDGAPASIRWSRGDAPHPDLSMVTVYDSDCASHYVEAEGSPSLQPYGLPQLARLVTLQRELQSRIASERDSIKTDAKQFFSLMGDTAVGQRLVNLGADTEMTSLRDLAALEESDFTRIKQLQEAAKEADVEPKARAMERLAARIRTSSGLAEEFQRWVSEKAVQRVRQYIDEERTAFALVKIAREKLSQVSGDGNDVTATGSGLLSGTGDGLWQLMYRAAEKFSDESAYQNHKFPHLYEGSKCVLCQQSLSEVAADRMRRFSEYVEGNAVAEADAASLKCSQAMQKLKALSAVILDDPTLAEMLERAPQLHHLVRPAMHNWEARSKWAISALESRQWENGYDDLPPETEIAGALLDGAISLEREAAVLRASVDPKERAALLTELRELEARKSLLENIDAIERHISNCRRVSALNKCYASLNPGPISRKITALAERYVTDALAASLNRELNSIGHRRRDLVELSGRTDLGATKLSLSLKNVADKAHLVLSEGEQRSLALAMFLAEIEGHSHKSAVVFDDPSTSFDHLFRRAIARRLVSLSMDRQVIVFTHDAVFLTELAMAAKSASASTSYQTVEWDDAPGLVSPGLPWGHQSAKERLETVKKDVSAIPDTEDTYQNNEVDRKIASAYSSLRGTIERAIREIFLNNTVQPFSDVVSVDSFGVIFSHPEGDWAKIDDIYTRACEAMEAHDTLGERHLPVPSKGALLDDIEALRVVIEAATQRRKQYERVRNEKNASRKSLFT